MLVQNTGAGSGFYKKLQLTNAGDLYALPDEPAVRVSLLGVRVLAHGDVLGWKKVSYKN